MITIRAGAGCFLLGPLLNTTPSPSNSYPILQISKARHREMNQWAQEAWWGGAEPDTRRTPAFES